MNRRDLFRACVAAIAAATVGKASAAQEFEVFGSKLLYTNVADGLTVYDVDFSGGKPLYEALNSSIAFGRFVPDQN